MTVYKVILSDEEGVVIGSYKVSTEIDYDIEDLDSEGNYDDYLLIEDGEDSSLDELGDKLAHDIRVIESQKTFDLVYLGSKNKSHRLLHIRKHGDIKLFCGMHASSSRSVYSLGVTTDRLHPVTCITCSKKLDKILAAVVSGK